MPEVAYLSDAGAAARERVTADLVGETKALSIHAAAVFGPRTQGSSQRAVA